MKKKAFVFLTLLFLPLSACANMSDFFNRPGTGDDGGDQYTVDTLTITHIDIINSNGKMKVYYSSDINPFQYPGLAFEHLEVNGVKTHDYMTNSEYHTNQYFEVTPATSQKDKASYTFTWFASDGYPYFEGSSNTVNQYEGEPDDPASTIPYPTGYSQLVFQDEFDCNSVNTAKWGYDVGGWGWGNDELQYYTEGDNSSVVDGCLHITARRYQVGSNYFTSSRMLTKGKFSCKYGYIEARISLPAVQAMWPAFWMLPESNVYGGWPYSGEIDIMEAKGRITNISSSALHHTTGVVDGGHTYEGHEQTFTSGTISDFHTYACEWSEDLIKFFVDGKQHFSVNSNTWATSAALDNNRAPFDQNFHIILNLAVGGQFDGYLWPEESFQSADMVVDYVRVFQK